MCTVSDSTVTMLAAGACVLTANQAGDANYEASPEVTLTVAIGAAIPTLSWLPDMQRTLDDPDFELPDPQSDSSGAFTFTSSDTDVAIVSGRIVTLIGPGVATLIATQAATADYLEASIQLTLTVSALPATAPTSVPVNGWSSMAALFGMLLLIVWAALRRRAY